MTTYQRKGKKYSKITFKKRLQLIDLIVKEGATITETSKKLNIKLPTAKAILASYRKKNHVFQRKIQLEQINQSFKDEHEVLSQELKEKYLQIVDKPQKEKIIPIIPQCYNLYNYSNFMQYWPSNINYMAYYFPQFYNFAS